MSKKVRVRQVRSGAHTLTASKEGLLPDERSLMLAGGDSQTYTLKPGQCAELDDSPAVRGMIRAVTHLVRVED